MTESKKSRDTNGNYLNILNFLSEHGRIYLGTLNSGENVVIQYTLVKEDNHTKVKAIIEPIQVNQFIEQSEQSESAPKQFVNKPVIDKNEQPHSALETFKPKRNQTLECLQQHFKKNTDLRELCFRLDITWEGIKENSIDETAIEIITYCERYYGKDSGCDYIINGMKQMRHPRLIERYFI